MYSCGANIDFCQLLEPLGCWLCVISPPALAWAHLRSYSSPFAKNVLVVSLDYLPYAVLSAESAKAPGVPWLLGREFLMA